MKILIAGALDPHENQEEKRLCEAVSAWYKKQGHTTDICYLPFKMDYHGIHEQIMAYRLLTTYPEAEMLVTVGYPAFALKHPNKHVLLLNFLPGFHTNYNTEYGFMESWYHVSKDQRIRGNLLRVEKTCLEEAKSIHCASRYLAEEVASLGCETGVFRPAYMLPQKGNTNAERNAYLVQSCLAPMDRIDLLLEAVKASNVKLCIFVPSAEDCYIEAVKARAARFSVSDCVQIARSEISISDLKAHRGVICLRRGSGSVPSWVFLAAEAGIPCVVPSDGGALCERQDDGAVVVVEPKSEAIANVLEKLNGRKKAQPSTESDLPVETTDLLGKWGGVE